jgi:hypothetical protein
MRTCSATAAALLRTHVIGDPNPLIASRFGSPDAAWARTDCKRHASQPPIGPAFVIRSRQPLQSLPAPVPGARRASTFSLAVGRSAEPRHYMNIRTISLLTG